MGIVNIDFCITSNLPIGKNKLPCEKNKHQLNLFTMCNNLFTVTGSKTMCIKIRLATEIFIQTSSSLFF